MLYVRTVSKERGTLDQELGDRCQTITKKDNPFSGGYIIEWDNV